jgi:hypothetical protein
MSLRTSQISRPPLVGRKPVRKQNKKIKKNFARRDLDNVLNMIMKKINISNDIYKLTKKQR